MITMIITNGQIGLEPTGVPGGRAIVIEDPESKTTIHFPMSPEVTSHLRGEFPLTDAREADAAMRAAPRNGSEPTPIRRTPQG